MLVNYVDSFARIYKCWWCWWLHSVCSELGWASIRKLGRGWNDLHVYKQFLYIRMTMIFYVHKTELSQICVRSMFQVFNGLFHAYSQIYFCFHVSVSSHVINASLLLASSCITHASRTQLTYWLRAWHSANQRNIHG